MHNIWKLNNMFLNNSWVEEEIKRQIRKYNIQTKWNEKTVRICELLLKQGMREKQQQQALNTKGKV